MASWGDRRRRQAGWNARRSWVTEVPSWALRSIGRKASVEPKRRGNGLDYVKIDSFLKILIRGLILLIALIINVYAERLRTARSGERSSSKVRRRLAWRRRPQAQVTSYCFGAGTVDALKGGGVFLSFAS
jgi:hypothetical protein